MQYFGIQEGALSGKLHIGLLAPKNTRFLGGEDLIDDDGEVIPGMDDHLSRLRHEDCTDTAIRVVADYVIKHFNGGLIVDYKDGTQYEIQVTQKAAERSA